VRARARAISRGKTCMATCMASTARRRSHHHSPLLQLLLLLRVKLGSHIPAAIQHAMRVLACVCGRALGMCARALLPRWRPLNSGPHPLLPALQPQRDGGGQGAVHVPQVQACCARYEHLGGRHALPQGHTGAILSVVNCAAEARKAAYATAQAYTIKKEKKRAVTTTVSEVSSEVEAE